MDADSISARYVQVHGRTVHYRQVGRGVPVVLLHPSPRSSSALVPLMRAAPSGLSLYAIDLPGFGRSSPLPSPGASIDAFADALADTLDRLGLARVRLYGTHTGAAVCLAFAARWPNRVARMVLDGLSAFTEAECRDLDAYLPPLVPDAAGTHMTWAWNRMRDQALFFPWNVRSTHARLWRPIPDPATLHAATFDLLVADDYRSAYAAAFRLDPNDRVCRLEVKTRIGVRESDVLRGHLDRLDSIPSCVTVRPFSNDAAAWSAEVWALLREDGGGDDAPPVRDGEWLASAIADSHCGRSPGRVHWRGCRTGTGRPLVFLHETPGSARSCERALAALVGRRPVYACDLPGHGESDPLDGPDVAALLDALERALDQMGFADVELAGVGIGSWLAHWLAIRRPRRWFVPGYPRPGGSAAVPMHAAARADGGHLNQAWLEARDAVILGDWWHRDPRDCVDFGESLDLALIHRAALDQLVETPIAATVRQQIAGLVRVAAQPLSATSVSRSPTLPRIRSVGRTP